MRIRGILTMIAAALVLSISTAAMAVIYSEDFNSALPDPTLIGYIPSTGTWSITYDPSGDGFLAFDDASNYGFIRYNGGSWSDYYQQVWAGMIQGASQFWIGGRLNPAGGGYYLRCWLDFGMLELFKADDYALLNGHETLAATLFNFEDDHEYGLHFDGSNITAYVDGIPVLSGSDTTFTSGSIGFGASSGTFTWFDNVIVTDQPPVIPEPSSIFALGTGIAGLAGILRRRTI